MATSLAIPEILRLVCDGADKGTSLSLALTCRAFLEPALDRLWNELASLQPLICCLPEDLLSKDGQVLTLNRPLTAEDVGRYLAVYANRIRSFALTPGGTKISLGIEVMNALQLVTEYRFGALSPRLQRFEWPDPDREYWPAPSVAQTSPYLSLFLGDTVRRIEIACGPALPPLYCGSVTFNTKRLTCVKELCLVNQSCIQVGIEGGTSPHGLVSARYSRVKMVKRALSGSPGKSTTPEDETGKDWSANTRNRHYLSSALKDHAKPSTHQAIHIVVQVQNPSFFPLPLFAFICPTKPLPNNPLTPFIIHLPVTAALRRLSEHFSLFLLGTAVPLAQACLGGLPLTRKDTQEPGIAKPELCESPLHPTHPSESYTRIRTRKWEIMDFIRAHICCCLGRSQSPSPSTRQYAHEHEIPNEATLLIPAEGDVEGGYGAAGGVGGISYEEQRRLERRLGGIVRSKERCVSPIPFLLSLFQSANEGKLIES
ncbi:hypothetical protein NMY22_g9488 [Coprinellus aureogranulatus]|nr:hypothetical protein NMY22_g9488 [Coprinellus aureogranulatus]